MGLQKNLNVSLTNLYAKKERKKKKDSQNEIEFINLQIQFRHFFSLQNK